MRLSNTFYSSTHSPPFPPFNTHVVFSGVKSFLVFFVKLHFFIRHLEKTLSTSSWPSNLVLLLRPNPHGESEVRRDELQRVTLLVRRSRSRTLQHVLEDFLTSGRRGIHSRISDSHLNLGRQEGSLPIYSSVIVSLFSRMSFKRNPTRTGFRLWVLTSNTSLLRKSDSPGCRHTWVPGTTTGVHIKYQCCLSRTHLWDPLKVG